MMYGEWISTEERKPDKQTPVLVCVPPYIDNDGEQHTGYVGMAYYTSFGDGFWAGTDGNLYGAIGCIHEPSHWMPLPDKPIADHPYPCVTCCHAFCFGCEKEQQWKEKYGKHDAGM